MTYSEVLELLNRKDHDDQVEEDVNASRCPSEGVKAHALAAVLAVPFLPRDANWNALQRSYDDKDYNVQNAKHDCTPDESPEPTVREDAKIEKQDRYLRQAARCEIEELGNVEDL
jgi:hypothetical protein